MFNQSLKKQQRKFLLILGGRRGFTLAESMVTIMIFAIIIGALYVALRAGDENWQTNKTRMELQQELRKAMEWMKFELMQAGNASITNVPANGTSYTTITFKVPTGVSNGSITWDANSIVYQVSSNQLQRVYNGATRILATNITTLQFERQATTSDILEVSLTAQGTTVKNKTVTRQINFEVQLRN